jgi:5-methyltetrahydropteroyltriglutamate--homocysteine methyltransferase
MPLLPAALAGSWPQPDWMIDRQMLGKRMPPRVRAGELWRVDPERLEQAQDDATILAIRDQERAGLDILTDGEIRRESYSNRFATALEGVDLDCPGNIISRSRANTDRQIKITVPGPFTLSQLVQNDYYRDEESMALDFAAAVNGEIEDLFAAGADYVQVDEPYMQAYPDKARQYGVAALNRALLDIKGTTAVHICFGYAALVAGRPDRRRNRAKRRDRHSIARHLRNCLGRRSSWACWIFRGMRSNSRKRWRGAYGELSPM